MNRRELITRALFFGAAVTVPGVVKAKEDGCPYCAEVLTRSPNVMFTRYGTAVNWVEGHEVQAVEALIDHINKIKARRG